MIPNIYIASIHSNLQECLWGFIYPNDTLIAIYGVIFTIGISLGVYIYGIQDRSEKSALIDKTKIGLVSILGILFFCLSFFRIDDFLNYLFILLILVLFIRIFLVVLDFNKDEYSKDIFIKKFKIKTIKDSLSNIVKFNEGKEKLNQYFDNKEKYTQYVVEEELNSYYLIKSKDSGFLEDIDINAFVFDIENDTTNSTDKRKIYVPFLILLSREVSAGDILAGIQKLPSDIDDQKIIKKNIKNKIDVQSERIRKSFIINGEFVDRSEYISRDLEEKFREIFELISTKNVIILEIKLKDISDILKIITGHGEYVKDILSNINDKIVLPLQNHAIKTSDIEVIRKVVSLSLGYVYDSVRENNISNFEMYFRNLSNSFYQSFNIENVKNKKSFQEMFFRWLNELAKYSIKPKLNKDGDAYKEFALRLLSALNSMMKFAFDKKDEDLFNMILGFMNDSFIRDTYEYEEFKTLDEVIKLKKATIFGFTSFLYKSYIQNKNNIFYMNILKNLLSSLEPDPYKHYSNNIDNINYYLSLYAETQKLSRKNLFGWDSWDMPEGQVYTVTMDSDTKKLLTDRILNIFISDINTPININDKNYTDDLALVKKDSSQFDVLNNMTKESFFASKDIEEVRFNGIKEKVYEVFDNVCKKYNEDVRIGIVEQKLDAVKFNEFAKSNLNTYSIMRVLNRIGDFIKPIKKLNDGFGYNILLNKEQFVSVSNVHYLNDEQFGENLAKSEDNKILELLLSKKSDESIKQINKKDLSAYISTQKDFDLVVLWVNNYYNLQDSDNNFFIPYWKDPSSKTEKGSYYQGSIDDKDVYMVYKIEEQKNHSDKIFLFKKNSFSIDEFEPDIESPAMNVDQLTYDSKDTSIHLSISNISDSKDEREKIVQNWIDKGSEKLENKENKVEELKTNVVLKLFKGIDLNSIKFNTQSIEIIEII